MKVRRSIFTQHAPISWLGRQSIVRTACSEGKARSAAVDLDCPHLDHDCSSGRVPGVSQKIRTLLTLSQPVG